jgi:PAS domain S-box-containing protein
VEARLVTWTTQRQNAEARSKQFLRIIEGTGDAAFAVDADGRISAWNKAAVELFGRSEAEVMNVPCHKLLQCSDEDGVGCSQHCVVEHWRIDDRPPVNFDVRLQTKVGRLWCNLSTLIASDPTSGARYAIHIVRPIEIRNRLEQALSEFVRLHMSSSSNGKPLICSAPTPGVNVRLTRRELEVLKSLAKGRTTRTIANQLNISSTTVKNHIKHILTKFGAHTRLEAIRLAEAAGII